MKSRDQIPKNFSLQSCDNSFTTLRSEVRTGCARRSPSSESFSGNYSIKCTWHVPSHCAAENTWWHQLEMIRIYAEMFPIPPLVKHLAQVSLLTSVGCYFCPTPQGQLNYTNNKLNEWRVSDLFVIENDSHHFSCLSDWKRHANRLIRKSSLDVSKSSWLSCTRKCCASNFAGEDIL